jgi:hypothetical protein
MTGGKFRLTKAYRETVDAAREYAATFGATVEVLKEGGKHPKIIVNLNGQRALAGFPSTPRDDNYQVHGQRAVRAALRQMKGTEKWRA